MRKVLLTTTALVALGGVSAASAIEISGGYMFDYNSTDNTGNAADAANVSGNKFGSDGNIDFKGSTTTDSGLTFGGMIRMQTNNDGGASAMEIEDQGLYISGDFGYIMMGQTDGVVDGMDSFMTTGNLVENGVATTNDANMNLNTQVLDNESAGKIGYRSNNISGFQFGVSHEDGGSGAAENDDLTSWIVTYDLMGAAKLGYASAKVKNASNTGADTTYTQAGISTSVAGFTIQAAVGTEKIAGAAGVADTSKVDTTDIGIQYSLNDSTGLYFVDVSSEDKTGTNSGDKLDGNTFGLSYSVAPGVSALLEYNDAEFKDSSASTTEGRTNTYVGLAVSF